MPKKIKAVLFDFMGTCLDWHTSITSALPAAVPGPARSQFALAWRQAYFDHNAARLAAGLGPQDIDASHRASLDALLARPEWAALRPALDADAARMVAAWHAQPAWPDVAPALAGLRAAGYEVLVHANGTARLQLDLARSSGLRGSFDALLSSELLGVLKPAAGSYARAVDLLRWRAEECVTVAAHAYDTRGAKEAGMKTVYVYRWTDDIREDQGVVRGEVDRYLEGMEGLVEAVKELDRQEEEGVL